VNCAFRQSCSHSHMCEGCLIGERCAFCGETGDLARCAWPEWRFVTTRYGELKIGDRVKRAIERLKHRAPATVVRKEPRPDLAALEVELSIRGRVKVIHVKAGSPVMVERPVVCKAVVCELHRAERGPKSTVCMDHWRAWEAVA
jgi:hypothetical protein